MGLIRSVRIVVGLGIAITVAPVVGRCDDCTPVTPLAIREIARVTPGFPVFRAAIAPGDGRALLMARHAGVALLDFADGRLLALESGPEAKTWGGFAPDGSEVWIKGSSGNTQRFDPRSGKKLTSPVLWSTNAAGISIESTELGRYQLTQDGQRVEVFGRIVIGTTGRPAVHDSVYVANGPETLLRYHRGALQGDARQPPRPVAGLALACSGDCLLSAADAQAPETFFWTLSPFDPSPTRLAGRVFLDAGHAALDCSGLHVLILSAGGLKRASLPIGPTSSMNQLTGQIDQARLSADARHAWIRTNGKGWRVIDAATMRPVLEPAWLDPDQSLATVAPDGRAAVLVDVNGGVQLVRTPYDSILRDTGDAELLQAKFSPGGTVVTLRRGRNYELLRVTDGNSIGSLRAARNLLFSRDDSYLLTWEDQVRVYRLTRDW